jgi:hypothetical protein
MEPNLAMVCFNALMNFKPRPVILDETKTKIHLLLSEEDKAILSQIFVNVCHPQHEPLFFKQQQFLQSSDDNQNL